MKTKHKILVENKWDFLYGHSLGYGRNPDYDNVIVERDEIEKLYKQTPQYFYFQDGDDCVRDEEEAWEMFCEQYCEDNDLDISSDDEFDKLMGVK